jgi:hypothetical protein
MLVIMKGKKGKHHYLVLYIAVTIPTTNVKIHCILPTHVYFCYLYDAQDKQTLLPKQY